MFTQRIFESEMIDPRINDCNEKLGAMSVFVMCCDMLRTLLSDFVYQHSWRTCRHTQTKFLLVDERELIKSIHRFRTASWDPASDYIPGDIHCTNVLFCCFRRSLENPSQGVEFLELDRSFWMQWWMYTYNCSVSLSVFSHSVGYW